MKMNLAISLAKYTNYAKDASMLNWKVNDIFQ